ncbi:MAG: hypothetical protein ACT4PY_04520 [Armatimonadota bacterium]
MRQLAGMLTVVILSAMASPRVTAQPAQPVAQAVAIMPGRSIGPFSVGMPLERAREIMAQYGTVDAYDGQLGHGFCNPDRGVGVCVFDRWARLNLETPGTVVFMLTDDNRFATIPGGHKVGQMLLDVLRTFGLYTSGRETELRWDAQGLAVDLRVQDDGLVVQFIGIYAPRTAAGR